MEIRLTLALPRDELSIPVVRRICTQSLTVLGVAQECQQDLELALAEACTNVLNHSGPGDHYEVVAGITDAGASSRWSTRGMASTRPAWGTVGRGQPPSRAAASSSCAR